MNGATGALIGCGSLAVLNLVIFAFGYGRLTQKVVDICQRIRRIEKKLGIDGD